MKVLFVRPDYGQSKLLYAIDYYALTIAEHEGYEVSLLGSEISHPDAASLQYIENYPSSINYSNLYRLYRDRLSILNKLCQLIKPDVVHIRNHIGDLLCLLLIKRLLPGCKVVLDIRSLSTTGFKHILNRILLRFYAKYFDHIFVQNDVIAEQYLSKRTAKSILPLGYSSKLFFKKNEGFNYPSALERGLSFIYIGSLSSKRSLQPMIDAVIYILDSGYNINLTIVGEGDESVLLQKSVKDNYMDKINFIPFLDKNELVEIVVKHDIGISYVPIKKVFDSNLPLKTLEMLALGMPVIATNTKGNRVLIKENYNGLLIQDNMESLAQAILDIILGDLNLASPDEISSGVSDYEWNVLTEKYILPVYGDLFVEKSINK